MKNRYLFTLLCIIIGSITIFFVITMLIFSSGVGQQRTRALARMSSFAAYAAATTQEKLMGNDTDPQAISQWLGQFSRGCGFERIVITSTTGMVLYSSQQIIQRGDDLLPFLAFPELFKTAASRTIPSLTPIQTLDGVSFNSLYYPCTIGLTPALIVLESNQDDLTLTQKVEGYFYAITLVLALLTIVMCAGIIWLTQVARKNQHKIAHTDRLAFLGRMSAELAHELKNPLAILKASADVLQKQFDPQHHHKAFTFLSEEVMRLSRLIDDMLAFSRERPLVLKKVQLAPLFVAITEPYKLIYPTIIFSLLIDNSYSITTDPDALRQAIDNLIRNAAQAMKETGSIKAEFSLEKQLGVLSLADSGPGVPESIRKTLFEPFVTSHNNGTGLGLAITKTVCERLGYTLALKPGSPTTFTISIPRNLWHTS